MKLILCMLCLCGALTASRTAESADKVKINQAIGKAAVYLKNQVNGQKGTYNMSLLSMTLLKAGLPANSEEIQLAVTLINNKIKDGNYEPRLMHLYEAGVDASLLADINPDAYKAQLAAISKYIIGQQRKSGSWDYPFAREGKQTDGDNSVIQYAAIGLWAGERAGVKVPKEVWENLVKWLLEHQMGDGGYTYVPGTAEGADMGRTNLSMTSAAMSAMLIAARHLYPGQADFLLEMTKREPKAEPKGKPGAGIKRVDIDDPGAVPPPASPQAPPMGEPAAGLKEIQDSLRKGQKFMDANFVPFRRDTSFPFYYYYSLERAGSLGNVEEFGGKNWYDSCSSALLTIQRQDGAWSTGRPSADDVRTTCFSVLFLARSTGKVLRRTESTPDPTVGGGMLTGGKGEPGKAPEAARKGPTSLDKLFASLENTDSINLNDAQDEIIEQLTVGSREELLGQKELILKLLSNPKPEVRQMAIWALGRMNDLSLTRHLIDALEDSHVGVISEANAALCWVSRRPRGFGLKEQPLDGIADDASEEVKQQTIKSWREEARNKWGNWYLTVRPYSERGDEFEAKLKARLSEG